ncbi:MAG: GNAT family N-acetyltransferase [Chitinophagaceae bacterium]|nr:GNAT family N-acetyltransferase [Chitinophagaceae bacterium]
MSHQRNIRPATIEDIELIRSLIFQIWPVTYQNILSKEQTDYMLNMMYSPTSLLTQFAEGVTFILVYEDALPIGFAAYKKTAATIYKLEKIYILANQQGKGTGQFIMEFLMEKLCRNKGEFLQLQVNRYNVNAKAFYEKLGFAVILEADFDIGNGFFMNDYVMEKKLKCE